MPHAPATEAMSTSRTSTIAVASGKGGTGKTTVSTNLARVLADERPVRYIDCDVEEPNGHLFLRPKLEGYRPVTTPVPAIDEKLCTHCGQCVDACEYNALAAFPGFTLVFPELCHGCGGCALVCPNHAITENQRTIGRVEKGVSGKVHFLHGILNVGEVQSAAVIKDLLSGEDGRELTIIDAPPGTSCPVVAAIRRADLLVLVTEPTPFGLNDLALAVDLARELSLKYGVVINRCDAGDARTEEFCTAEGIPVWGRFSESRRVAEAYSRGEMAVDAVPEIAEEFQALARTLMEVGGC